MRKASLLVKVFHVLINYEGNNQWSFRVRSLVKNADSIFKINEEYEESKSSIWSNKT